jgi:hypothetical protein
VVKNISVSKGYTILGSAINGQRFVSGNGVSIDAGSFGYIEFLDEDLDEPVAHEITISTAESPVDKWIKTLSLLDVGINSYLNSDLKAGNISKALNMSRNHLRAANIRKNSKGANK